MQNKYGLRRSTLIVAATMKWAAVLCVFLAVLSAVMVNVLGKEQEQESEFKNAQDFTSKYAELASPVPSNVNVDSLVQNLMRAGQQANN